VLYRILLFIHVLAAAAWVGGGLYNYLHGLSIRASKDPARMGAFARETQEFASKYFAPAAIVSVISGVWLVFEGDWDWDFWVLSGLAVWLYSLISNTTWLEKLGKKMEALVAEKGPTSPEVQAAGQEMFKWRTIEIVLLVFVIFAMTYKPFA
jgi:uncharacterized membrane protein